MTVETDVRVSATISFGAPFVLTPCELRTPTQWVDLKNVTHVALIDRPARTPTRHMVQWGALAAGFLMGAVSYLLNHDRQVAAILILLPLLAGVLLSDWAEDRFPTPGRYGIEVSSTDGALRVDGLVSEAAAHMLHEQVGAAVRAAQGLNG